MGGRKTSDGPTVIERPWSLDWTMIRRVEGSWKISSDPQYLVP